MNRSLREGVLLCLSCVTHSIDQKCCITSNHKISQLVSLLFMHLGSWLGSFMCLAGGLAVAWGDWGLGLVHMSLILQRANPFHGMLL